jgi:diaminopropionate ammonia-lyase
VVEASAADCHYRSALRGDGQLCTVEGELNTMMAGLACGEPNPVSWSILRNHAAAFVSCPDWVAAEGMRMLARPQAGDAAITSGESGAVGMGLAAAVMKLPQYRPLRDALGLSVQSRLLLISTEGDTDPVNYCRVLRQQNEISL